jgi:hypothetical protein
VSKNMARETEPMDEASKPTNNTRTATCGVETGLRGPLLCDTRQIFRKDCTVQDNGAIGPVAPLSEVTGVESEPKFLASRTAMGTGESDTEPPSGGRRMGRLKPYCWRSGRSSLSQGKPGTWRRTTGSMPDEPTSGRHASISALDDPRKGQRDHVSGCANTWTWRAVCVERRMHGSGEGEQSEETDRRKSARRGSPISPQDRRPHASSMRTARIPGCRQARGRARNGSGE